jgi:hypothetical protein
MLSWRLLVAAIALVTVGITEATSSQAVPLTKEENAQVLAAALVRGLVHLGFPCCIP